MIFKNSVLLIAIYALLFPITGFSQKVKLKDGQVLVNKEHLYNFEKVDCSNESANLKCFTLTNLEGEEILSFMDSSFNYVQLPNELEPRSSFFAYKVISAKDNISGVIPYLPAYSRKKQRVKQLGNLGVFKTGQLEKEMVNTYVAEHYPESLQYFIDEKDKQNKIREENYVVSKEKFGELLNRKPGKISVKKTSNTIKEIDGESVEIETHNISDGDVIVGKILLMAQMSSKKHVYKILNLEGRRIGELTILKKMVKEHLVEKYKYSVTPIVYGEEEVWFEHKLTETNKSNISLNEQLTNISKFLIEGGLL